MYYNPTEYNILPYKHNHTDSGETVYTAFFIPAYSMHIASCDNRGVCNEIDARIYYNSERVKKSSNNKNLLEYKSEYCFTAEEALIRQGDSRFDTEKLAEQIAAIELHKTVPKPKKAKLLWRHSKELGEVDRNSVPEIEFTDSGMIDIAELPMQDENGIPYANLYVAGIDSIDTDESSSTGQKDVSSFCIVIKRRQLGLMEPKYVAIYKDRPKDVRTAYDNAIKLLQFYNCKAVVETTRTSLITYFKEHKQLKLLFHRPKATQSDINKGNTKMYGSPATVTVINHYLDLIENYVNDYADQIEFLPMLEELIKYSFTNKRKYDIVAATGMAELADEELMGTAPRTTKVTKKDWVDVGYYKDEYGRLQYGVIPNKNNQLKGSQYDWIRNQNF